MIRLLREIRGKAQGRFSILIMPIPYRSVYTDMASSPSELTAIIEPIKQDVSRTAVCCVEELLLFPQNYDREVSCPHVAASGSAKTMTPLLNRLLCIPTNEAVPFEPVWLQMFLRGAPGFGIAVAQSAVKPTESLYVVKLRIEL